MPPAELPPVLVLVGPTAVGKSDVAMRLAERSGAEIVSGDALQAYRGFDIGTAKPSPEERRRVRHHLVDILDPEETWSAGEFATAARAAVAEIQGRGAPVIVCGGSGFYLRALLDGLAAIPTISGAVREGLLRRLRADGLEVLRRDLDERDPVSAARIADGDSQRTLRALEVLEATGRPISEWQAESELDPADFHWIRVGLTLPRPLLYDRIERRAGRMIEKGWVDEVASLLRRGVDREAPAFQAIGYRALAAHARGERSLEDALSETIRETRRYAKRQETWFRRDEMKWFSAEDPVGAEADLMGHWLSAGSTK